MLSTHPITHPLNLPYHPPTYQPTFPSNPFHHIRSHPFTQPLSILQESLRHPLITALPSTTAICYPKKVLLISPQPRLIIQEPPEVYRLTYLKEEET